MTFLRRQLRERDLRELLLMSELIDAKRAQEIGLVNRVVAPDELLPLAKTVLSMKPGSRMFGTAPCQEIVLTGDPYQIDNPYVDAESNGLTWLVERFKGQYLAGHVTLLRGERSELAELAANLL